MRKKKRSKRGTSYTPRHAGVQKTRAWWEWLAPLAQNARAIMQLVYVIVYFTGE